MHGVVDAVVQTIAGVGAIGQLQRHGQATHEGSIAQGHHGQQAAIPLHVRRGGRPADMLRPPLQILADRKAVRGQRTAGWRAIGKARAARSAV